MKQQAHFNRTLIDAIAANSGLSKNDARLAYVAVMRGIEAQIRKGEDVPLRGVGNLRFYMLVPRPTPELHLPCGAVTPATRHPSRPGLRIKLLDPVRKAIRQLKIPRLAPTQVRAARGTSPAPNTPPDTASAQPPETAQNIHTPSNDSTPHQTLDTLDTLRALRPVHAALLDQAISAQARPAGQATAPAPAKSAPPTEPPATTV